MVVPKDKGLVSGAAKAELEDEAKLEAEDELKEPELVANFSKNISSPSKDSAL